MIRLTWTVSGNEGALYVPENVVIVEANGTNVTVPGTDGHWTVKESPEEVARKVLEYRLARGAYKTHPHMSDFVRQLKQLAGLEEVE